MIDFKVKSGSPEKQRSSCLVLAVYEDQGMSPSARVIDKSSKGTISRLIKRGDITGECGETILLPEIGNIQADRVLLVGCGNEDDFDNSKLLKITAKVIQRLQVKKINEAMLFLPEIDIGRY